MSYAQWRNTYTFFCVHVGIILILVLGIYSCLVELGRSIFSVYV
jgi:hypothetical protein